MPLKWKRRSRPWLSIICRRSISKTCWIVPKKISSIFKWVWRQYLKNIPFVPSLFHCLTLSMEKNKIPNFVSLFKTPNENLKIKYKIWMSIVLLRFKATVNWSKNSLPSKTAETFATTSTYFSVTTRSTIFLVATRAESFTNARKFLSPWISLVMVKPSRRPWTNSLTILTLSLAMVLCTL